MERAPRAIHVTLWRRESENHSLKYAFFEFCPEQKCNHLAVRVRDAQTDARACTACVQQGRRPVAPLAILLRYYRG